jgi:hypothetical protein
MVTRMDGPAWRNETNPVSITLDDGAVFRCWAGAAPGGAMVSAGQNARESFVRWVFRDEHGREHRGPVVDDPNTTLEELRVIVADWAKQRSRSKGNEAV